MQEPARSARVDVWRPGGGASDGRVAVEEPLEIRIDGHLVVLYELR